MKKLIVICFAVLFLSVLFISIFNIVKSDIDEKEITDIEDSIDSSVDTSNNPNDTDKDVNTSDSSSSVDSDVDTSSSSGNTDKDIETSNNNLLSYDDFSYEYYYDSIPQLAKDISIYVDDFGNIVLKGYNKSSIPFNVHLQTLTLEMGAYTLSSGNQSLGNEYFKVYSKNGSNYYEERLNYGNTFYVLEETRTIYVYIVIPAYSSFEDGIVFRPVLVKTYP